MQKSSHFLVSITMLAPYGVGLQLGLPFLKTLDAPKFFMFLLIMHSVIWLSQKSVDFRAIVVNDLLAVLTIACALLSAFFIPFDEFALLFGILTQYGFGYLVGRLYSGSKNGLENTQKILTILFKVIVTVSLTEVILQFNFVDAYRGAYANTAFNPYLGRDGIIFARANFPNSLPLAAIISSLLIFEIARVKMGFKAKFVSVFFSVLGFLSLLGTGSKAAILIFLFLFTVLKLLNRQFVFLLVIIISLVTAGISFHEVLLTKLPILGEQLSGFSPMSARVTGNVNAVLFSLLEDNWFSAADHRTKVAYARFSTGIDLSLHTLLLIKGGVATALLLFTLMCRCLANAWKTSRDYESQTLPFFFLMSQLFLFSFSTHRVEHLLLFFLVMGLISKRVAYH